MIESINSIKNTQPILKESPVGVALKKVSAVKPNCSVSNLEIICKPRPVHMLLERQKSTFTGLKEK